MILLTGATGLVGHYLLAELIKSHDDVKALYRTETKRDRAIIRIQNLLPEAKQKRLAHVIWVKADLTNVPDLKKVFENVTHVYHCAGLVSFNVRDKHRLRKVNIEGTANMVNLALENNVAKFCHLSSVSALGSEPDGRPIHEKSPRNNNKFHSYYDISKYGAEMEVWRGTQEGLRAVIVNPAIIIGAGNWTSGSGQIFKLTAQNFPFRVPRGSGFVSVHDVVSAMAQLMDSPLTNERFIVVNQTLNMAEFTELVAQHLNTEPPKYALKQWMVTILWLVQSVGYVFGGNKVITRESISEIFESVYFDNSKLKETLGFKYTPLEDAVKETAKAYLAEHQ